ncbi:MAG TPA: DUF1579 domain-containing protein [Longimicrobiaceae bacterium]|nr:DUF1579 domain-containing protein [Longimicrobiaceae bacterium]
MEAERQQEHRWLERLVGEWTSEMEMAMKPGEPPQTFTGTESVRSLGGLWVLCEGRGEMPGGGESTTIMTLGYDPAKRRFLGTFIGALSTHMWIYDGELDAAGDRLTLHTEGPAYPDETRMAKYTDTIEFRGDDHRVLTSRVQDEGGAWRQMMEVHYRRTR